MNAQESFTRPGSIARRIWGDADAVMLVFAGAAAEFALNRAVDWLFTTGALPRDPIGRLFSTAAYAQNIVFSSTARATHTLSRIRAQHTAVEKMRDERIPDWAHRDVLYLLVDYSERCFQALHRPLVPTEKEELWATFRRVGEGLGMTALPADHEAWREDRERHLLQDLAYTEHTKALYAAYRRDLGPWRYLLLRYVQAALVPVHVRQMLGLPSQSFGRALLLSYPLLVRTGLRPLVHRALIPPEHLPGIRRLDHPANR